MSCILVTGASGFIGKALAAKLAERHDVVAMSRKNPELDSVSFVPGEFGEFEDLRRLDPYPIEAVVHLAAVTGDTTERSAVLVNGEGSRCLMRYLLDRGCRKFVLASSIALVGFQSTAFRPLRLPIPDDHPCLDRDGYGFSKHLMEQIARFYARQNPELDVTQLRLSTVVPDNAQPEGMMDLMEWSLGRLTFMLLSDAVELFVRAIESPADPGERTMNAACHRVWSSEPTARLLKHWYGGDADVSHFEQPGHEFDCPYDVSCLNAYYGFEATRTLATLARHQKAAAGA